MKSDIKNLADIRNLVDHFYYKVARESSLGPIFNDVAQIDWEHHLPRMYSFWESVLFASGNFKGNPMPVHIELAGKTEMGKSQFNIWLTLWRDTVDELFCGEVANEAKSKASSIANLMMYKIKGDWT